MCPSSRPPLADSEGVEVEEAVAEMQLQDRRCSKLAGIYPPLMGVVGPLLAKPGPEAREAVRQELEGSSSSQAPVPFGMAGIDAPQPVEAKGKKKKAKKAQGPDVPGYDLYNEARQTHWLPATCLIFQEHGCLPLMSVAVECFHSSS
eukprot:g32367.t1